MGQESFKTVKKVKFDDEQLLAKETKMDLKMKEEILFIKSRKKVAHFTTTELITKDEIRRNLVITGAISWSVKLIDSMLFSIWISTPKSSGGRGFTSMQTGAISLLSFPCVAFAMVTCFRFTQSGKQANWLLISQVGIISLILLI